MNGSAVKLKLEGETQLFAAKFVFSVEDGGISGGISIIFVSCVVELSALQYYRGTWLASR